jgi:hypothetical protein
MRAILDNCNGVGGHKMVVIKAGEIFSSICKIRRQYTDAKFICLFRDPRAVFASQKRSRASTSDRRMARNPVHIAYAFRKAVNSLRNLRGQEWILYLRFEDLIARPESTWARIIEFVRVEGEGAARGSYAERIPESQKHLHCNIEKGPMEERIDAWESELQIDEVAAIEALVGRHMRVLGYERRLRTGDVVTNGGRVARHCGAFLLERCLSNYQRRGDWLT